MANIDERVRKLELTFARLASGAAVLVVVVLGFFGFTTVYQVPHEVERQIPEAVAKEIKKKYPNIEEELRRRMADLADSGRRARAAAELLEQLATTHAERLASLETAIKAKRFHDFGYIDCGKPKTLTVPEGTTDEWVLFSANPHISAEEKRKTGDNALYAIATSITPQADEKSWSVTFSVRVNYATNRKSADKTDVDCNWEKLKSTPKVQILAIRTG